MIVPARFDSPKVRRLLEGLADHYVSTYGAHDLDEDDPTDYASPVGGCLIGIEDGEPVAVACWRRHDADSCELRRFYVVPSARGGRRARRMLEAVLDAAEAAGYRRALCATVAREGLRGLDLREIDPYGPHADQAGVGCYEIDLAGATTGVPA